MYIVLSLLPRHIIDQSFYFNRDEQKRMARGTKESHAKKRKEYKNMIKAQLTDFVAKKREQKKEQGREGFE